MIRDVGENPQPYLTIDGNKIAGGYSLQSILEMSTALNICYVNTSTLKPSIYIYTLQQPVIGVSKKFDKIKISVRADNKINVGLTLKRLAYEFGGHGGGHINAGGCILDEAYEKDFIYSLVDILSS